MMDEGDARREDMGAQHAQGDGSSNGPVKKRRRRRKPAGTRSPDNSPASKGDIAPPEATRARDGGNERGADRAGARGGETSGQGSGGGKRGRSRRRGSNLDDAPKTDRPNGEPSEHVEGDERSGEPLRRRRKPLAPPAEIVSDPDLFALDTTFADLGLNAELVRGLEEVGFKHPTHIQARLIPPMIAGKDVLGQAKTGTGKTAAFGLPIMERVKLGAPFQALVLCPTRELAIQIRDGLRELARFSEVRICAVYGGQRMQQQIDELQRGPEIIVGTPGRVMDMAQRGILRLENVRMAVLDEVDRMLDIGFREDIKRILRQCPKERQTAMVSATLSPEIEDLARRHMNNPDKIVTTSGSLTVKIVQQRYLSVESWDKKRLLAHLLLNEEPALTLIFCRLKRTVDDLDEYLRRKGIECHAIHGDMRQNRRDSVIKKLRSGKLEVLIASDLAARGLDVEGITHVINYDLPEDPDLYVHRIGRTARVGRDGVAWSFVTPQQGKLLTHIERLIDAEIPRMEYPDFVGSERPAGFRDDSPTRPVIRIDAPPPVNRLAAPSVPRSAPKSEREKQKLAAKFPGGVVPTKLPPKRMHGKLSTGRGG